MVISPFPLTDAKPELTDFLDAHRLATLYEVAETHFGHLDEAIRRGPEAYMDRCSVTTAGRQSRPKRASQHPPQRHVYAIID